MSELYKRSLGYPFDERLARREVENGIGSCDPVDTTPAFEGPSDLMITAEDMPQLTKIAQLRQEIADWYLHAELSGGLNDYESSELIVLEAELVVEECSEAMSALASTHPRYTALVAKQLTARLDAMAAFGEPVDPEMYVDAHAMADEIVSANPDKNADELTTIVETMMALIQAEYQRRQLALVA